MNKKIMFLLIIIIIITIGITLKLYKSKNDNSLEEIISYNLEQIIKNPSESSNPYDYINNKYYQNIVNYGDDALDILLKMMANSNEDGLKEYIIAIACTEIMSENKKSGIWSTGKEWYNNYIQSLNP